MAILRFGSDFSHADYVVPMAKIQIYKDGETERGAAMYIRMGGTFNTTIRAAYDDAQGIFGTPFTTDQNILSKLGSVGSGLASALQAQFVRGVSGVAGTLASAGLSDKTQIEFLTRTFLSNFQQVVYRGPSFRIFTLPFVMKPTSLTEARSMRIIIAALKAASVPKVGEYTVGGVFKSIFKSELNTRNEQELQEELKKLRSDPTLIGTEEQLNKIIALENDLTSEQVQFIDSLKSPITFGYPDVCSFELVLVKGNSDITTVFRSEKCVIEAVTVDYGSSNKMTFFDSDSNEYYPTEVTLTLNLKEIVFQTNKTIYDYDNLGSSDPFRYTIL